MDLYTIFACVAGVVIIGAICGIHIYLLGKCRIKMDAEEHSTPHIWLYVAAYWKRYYTEGALPEIRCGHIGRIAVYDDFFVIILPPSRQHVIHSNQIQTITTTSPRVTEITAVLDEETHKIMLWCSRRKQARLLREALEDWREHYR